MRFKCESCKFGDFQIKNNYGHQYLSIFCEKKYRYIYTGKIKNFCKEYEIKVAEKVNIDDKTIIQTQL